MNARLVFIALWALAFFAGNVSAQNTTLNSPKQLDPNWMDTDIGLRTKVTVDLDAIPLRQTLADLSHKSKINIMAERSLGEYRVCLHAKSASVAHVMRKIQDLFGHGNLPNRGYEWIRTVENGRISYGLYRNWRGRQEEEDALNLPHKRIVQWLHEVREFMALPPDKRKSFKSNCPMLAHYIKTGESLQEDVPSAEAIAALTESQLKELVENRYVYVPQLKLSDNALAYLAKAIPPGNGVPSTFDDYNPPGQAELHLEAEGRSELNGLFAVTLSFHSGFPRYCPVSVGLDTMRQLPTIYADDIVTERSKEGPQIDLLAHETGTTNKPYSCSLAKALNLLAREAGISIYAESFPKPQQSLRGTKGNLEWLLATICRTFACQWRKVGNDYLIYSKSWAQDRVADIPQGMLDQWQSTYARERRYDLRCLIEMASLTEEQQVTVVSLLGVSAPFGRDNRNALRLLATLSPRELDLAFTPAGVDLNSLDDDHGHIVDILFGRVTILPIHVRIGYTPQVRGGSPSYVDIEYSDQVGVGRTFSVRDYSEMQ